MSSEGDKRAPWRPELLAYFDTSGPDHELCDPHHGLDPAIPELTRLARTLDSWVGEAAWNAVSSRISNGPTEAINLLIKKIKRIGHGCRSTP